MERNPHGIFAAGGAFVPTQEKKKDLRKLGNVRKVPKPHRMIAHWRGGKILLMTF